MMAKGTYAGILLATKDLDGTFAQLQASGVEVIQEPADAWGTAFATALFAIQRAT